MFCSHSILPALAISPHQEKRNAVLSRWPQIIESGCIALRDAPTLANGVLGSIRNVICAIAFLQNLEENEENRPEYEVEALKLAL